MDIRDLRYFVAVYEAKGFSRACAVLDTVQSNVSARVQRLERFLGVALFERRYRTIVPTGNGEALYVHAKHVIATLDHMEHIMRSQAADRATSRRARWIAVNGGFTLLELLVVVVIIGLLAGFVAPRYFSQVGRSEVQIARAQIDAFEKALDQYRLDTRGYPTAEQGLKALVERPASEPRWSGPYLRKDVPLDPWGRAYVYRVPGAKGEYDLISYGRDGQPGGIAEAADIANH